MELDSSFWPCNPFIEAEKQFWKQRGLCNYCDTYLLDTAYTKLAQQDTAQAVRFPIKSHKMLLSSTLLVPIEESKN